MLRQAASLRFTHAMIGDARLPTRVLEADTVIASCGLENFERTSWSKQHTHKFGGSHDELATVGRLRQVRGKLPKQPP